jgi:hypothetical protein
MKRQSKQQDFHIEKDYSLQTAMEETVQEMLKSKEENPDLIIPYSFLEFYNKPEMLELLSSVFEYCKCLAGINSRCASLREEGKFREAKSFSEIQSRQLPDLGRQAAQRYGELLLIQRRVVSKIDDQNFFETVIYFLIRTVQPAFKKDQSWVIDEEINRLFRSTAFNITNRRLAEDEKLKKFPLLKKPYSRRDHDAVIKNILLRGNYLREKAKSGNFDGINRPGFVKISPYMAITSRSPLISLLLPSPRDKIRAFEENRKNLAKRKSAASIRLK